MSKGVEFYFKRSYKLKVTPPFSTRGQLVFGRNADGGVGMTVAFMHDYYSVGAEEQRQMAENTVALCEILYTTQEHQP